MANPAFIVSAGVLALIGVFAGYNFVTAQLENGEIKEEGIRLSEPLIVSAFTASAGPRGARIKADHSTYIQNAKDFPWLGDSAWEGRGGDKAPCSQFFVEFRDTTNRIAYAFGATGIYSDEELEFSARTAKVAAGVLALSARDILESNSAMRPKLENICTKASASLGAFYDEASRRVSRKLQGPAMSAESLAGQTTLVMGEAFPAFFRAYNYSQN